MIYHFFNVKNNSCTLYLAIVLLTYLFKLITQYNISFTYNTGLYSAEVLKSEVVIPVHSSKNIFQKILEIVQAIF